MNIVVDPDILYNTPLFECLVAIQKLHEYLDNGEARIALDRGPVEIEYRLLLVPYDSESLPSKTLEAELVQKIIDNPQYVIEISSEGSEELKNQLESSKIKTPLEPELVSMAYNAPEDELCMLLLVGLPPRPGTRLRDRQLCVETNKRQFKKQNVREIRYASEFRVQDPLISRERDQTGYAFEDKCRAALPHFWKCSAHDPDLQGEVHRLYHKDIDVYCCEIVDGRRKVYIAECKFRQPDNQTRPLNESEINQILEELAVAKLFEDRRGGEYELTSYIITNSNRIEQPAKDLADRCGVKILKADIAAQGGRRSANWSNTYWFIQKIEDWESSNGCSVITIE